jgi:hypothetical protein
MVPLRGAATTVGLIALTLLAPPLARGQRVAGSDSAARTPAPSSRAQQAGITDELRRQIDAFRASREDGHVPPADSFTVGSRAIPVSATMNGTVAVAGGSLDVFGRVDGSAFVLDGDIIVHRGGVITGDAIAVGGRVTLDGGRVDGEIRTLSGPPEISSRAERAEPPRTTWQFVKLVFGWFAILVVIGLGVMIFAEPNLDGVVAAMESGFSRAFWLGVLGQILALPALLLLCAGLVLTLLGILLVPFAVVAYAIVVAGLLTLGFLAVARLTGGIWVHSEGLAPADSRGQHVRALFVGLVFYLGLWMLAALFTWQPIAGAVLRGLALALTWVAATVGLGAALLSRAGTQRPNAAGTAAGGIRPAPDDLAWQTPTPVTGVAAARRPQPAGVKDAP